MSIEPNESVSEALEVAISKYGEIGLQVCAYLDGEKVIDAWAGVADETTGAKVDAETLFPIFSVTKAIAAVALHIQAERGLIDYSRPVAHYWPEFGAHGKDKGTVYDALVHRLGVPTMPIGVTPELACDWQWMVERIADMRPIFEPGTRTAYHAYTYGWVIGELVRRTDPKKRGFSQFIHEELCHPIGMDSLFVGIPDHVEPRIARLRNPASIFPGGSGVNPAALLPLAMPTSLATTQEVFGRPDVRRTCFAAANGIANARSLARFFAMLAQGGELDGVRLLGEHRVRTFSVPRAPAEYDYVRGVGAHNISIGGFHMPAPIAGLPPMVQIMPAGTNPRSFGHPGMGGTIGWCDPDARLAVGITHNRMFESATPEGSPMVYIGNAVRKALGVTG